jgi:hypothetical protein
MHSWPTTLCHFSFLAGNAYAQSSIICYCCVIFIFIFKLAMLLRSWPVMICHLNLVTGNAYAQSSTICFCYLFYFLKLATLLHSWPTMITVDPWQFVSFLLWLATHMRSRPTPIWWFSFVTGNAYAQSTSLFLCDWQRICAVGPW